MSAAWATTSKRPSWDSRATSPRRNREWSSTTISRISVMSVLSVQGCRYRRGPRHRVGRQHQTDRGAGPRAGLHLDGGTNAGRPLLHDFETHVGRVVPVRSEERRV